MLCRHALKVFISEHVEVIPDKYVVLRWIRGLVPTQIQTAKVRYGEVDSQKERLMNGVYSIIDDIVTSVRNDNPEFQNFYDMLCWYKHTLNTQLPDEDDVEQQKMDAINDHYGVAVPDDPDVYAPTGLRNKGSGTGKRLEGISEKMQKKARNGSVSAKLAVMLLVMTLRIVH